MHCLRPIAPCDRESVVAQAVKLVKQVFARLSQNEECVWLRLHWAARLRSRKPFPEDCAMRVNWFSPFLFTAGHVVAPLVPFWPLAFLSRNSRSDPNNRRNIVGIFWILAEIHGANLPYKMSVQLNDISHCATLLFTIRCNEWKVCQLESRRIMLVRFCA